MHADDIFLREHRLPSRVICPAHSDSAPLTPPPCFAACHHRPGTASLSDTYSVSCPCRLKSRAPPLPPPPPVSSAAHPFPVMHRPARTPLRCLCRPRSPALPSTMAMRRSASWPTCCSGRYAANEGGDSVGESKPSDTGPPSPPRWTCEPPRCLRPPVRLPPSPHQDGRGCCTAISAPHCLMPPHPPPLPRPFRMGGAAALLSNKPSLRHIAKYELRTAGRVHTGKDDDAYG